MIVSKPTIVFHTSQIFFNFLAMACFASVASFQAKWNVGPCESLVVQNAQMLTCLPAGLTGFAIFISVAGICLSLFMLMVPVVYEKYDKFVRLARALKEVRVGFILTGTGVTASLLISYVNKLLDVSLILYYAHRFIVTISAWTQPGCKNPDNDPHAGDKDKGDEFKKGLEGWCSTKKAGAIFFWLAFGALNPLILSYLHSRLSSSLLGCLPRAPHPRLEIWQAPCTPRPPLHPPTNYAPCGRRRRRRRRFVIPPHPTHQPTHLTSRPLRQLQRRQLPICRLQPIQRSCWPATHRLPTKYGRLRRVLRPSTQRVCRARRVYPTCSRSIHQYCYAVWRVRDATERV